MAHINFVIINSDGCKTHFRARSDLVLQKVINSYKERLCIASPIYIKYKGNYISLDQTLESLGINDGAKLYSFYNNQEIDTSNMIDIAIVAEDNSITFMKVKKDIKLETVMKSYVQKMGINSNMDIIVVHNDKTLSMHKTLSSEEVINNDRIYVYIGKFE